MRAAEVGKRFHAWAWANPATPPQTTRGRDICSWVGTQMALHLAGLGGNDGEGGAPMVPFCEAT
jgi:hypothetical protein